MERRMVYAAAAVAIFAVVTVTGIVVSYNGLRGGFLPWGVCGLAVAASFIAWQYRRRPLGSPRRALVFGSVLVQVVLLSMGAFFLAVAAGNAVGSHALRHTDGGLASVATLLGSVEVMVLLPLGLVALAVAAWRDRSAPRELRILPTVAVVVFAMAPILVGALPDSTERPVMVVWVAAIAATWVALARGLGRTRSLIGP
ncbi:MAG: hypothetical protein ABR520_13050 [Mycobacteriales bacterium]|nr:hypothetical protein [Frankia sp.]